MPIFAAQNPPRVENTEARPPLKRWAYFLKSKSKRDMDKQKVIVYVDGFRSNLFACKARTSTMG